MSENVTFQKQVYSKSQYSKVIDTSFTQLGVQTVAEQIAAEPTVNDFFAMYNDLFYDIPEMGDTNSHEYLINKSSEYINFIPNQEEIVALQNEISQLRIELLDAQRQVIEIQTQTPTI